MRIDPSVRIYYHPDKEVNLRAAKQSLSINRHAWMSHSQVCFDDIIDIVQGGKVIERHIWKCTGPLPTQNVRRQFCIEEMTLYQ